MGRAQVHRLRTALLQDLGGRAHRSRGVDHVIVDDADLALDVADDGLDFRLVVAGTALVHDGHVGVHEVGQLLGSLRTAHVRRHHAQLVLREALGLEVVGEDGKRRQVVHRDVEEALDLALVQVDGDQAVDAGDLEEIGHKFCGDGLARGGFAVLARVAVVGHHGGDAAGGGAACGVGHDEELHQGVVHVFAGDALDEEDVVAADAFQIARVHFAVREFLEADIAQLDAELFRHFFSKRPVHRPAEDLDVLHHADGFVLVHARTLSCFVLRCRSAYRPPHIVQRMRRRRA